MLRNEYFVKPLSTAAINYKAELLKENSDQAQAKLDKEQLEQQQSDLEKNIRRLKKGFSWLIYFQDLIDFEEKNPRALQVWNGTSQTYSTCKANARGICNYMDEFPKIETQYFLTPEKSDMQAILAEEMKEYYLPYMTNESTSFQNYEGLTVASLKHELEQTARDFYERYKLKGVFKFRDKNYSIKPQFSVTSSWPFDNNAQKLQAAQEVTRSIEFACIQLRTEIEKLKNEVTRLQKGFSHSIFFKKLIDFEKNNPRALQYKDTQAYDSEKVQTCETNAEKICTYMHDITKQSNVTKQLLSDFADLVRNYSEFQKIKQFMVFHKPEHEHLYKLRKELVNDAIKLYKEKGGAGGVYIEEPEPDELTPADREWSKNQENDNRIRASFEQGHNDSNQQVKKFYNAPGAGIKTRARVGDSLVTSSFGFSGTSKKDLEELVKSKKELAESNKELAGLKIIINKARIALFWQYKDLDKVKRGNRTETKAEKEDNEYMYQQRLNKIFGPDENFDKQYLSLLMDETNYKKIVARNEKFLETLMEEGKKYQETFTKAI